MTNAIFSDNRLKEEFLDRFSSLNQIPTGHNTSFRPSIKRDTVPNVVAPFDKALDTINRMQDGRPLEQGLEAIVIRFARPAYYIKNRTFDAVNTTHSSEIVNDAVNTAKASIDLAIPKVGQIKVSGHAKTQVGSGWIIAENTLVTSRSVATQFTTQQDDVFTFMYDHDHTTTPTLDTLGEYQSQAQTIYKLRKVLWIPPTSDQHDVAFLSIDPISVNGDPQPLPIALMTSAEYAALDQDQWMGVIGYPALDLLGDTEDQQHVFDGCYDVKRLQPGKITAKSGNGLISHDATTIGSNSGSVIVDLESGKAAALHCSSAAGDQYDAISAPVLNDLMEKHVLPVLDFV